MTEKQKFMAWKYETLAWRPSTKIGNFDALYEPKAGTLTITVKCHFKFRDGKASDWEDEELEEGDTPKWSERAKAAWKAEFMRRVSAHWSDKFTFHCTRDWWEDLRAVVKVRFVEARSAKDAHYVVNVQKIPEMGDRKSRVKRPKSHGKGGVAY